MFAACGEPVSDTTEPTAAPTAAPAAKPTAVPTAQPTAAPIVSAERAFENDFIRYIADSTDKSYVVSPLSFKYALAMLTAGTAGNTQAELLRALNYSDTAALDKDMQAFGTFADRFNKFAEEYNLDGHALQVANSIWKRSDLPAFKSGFTGKMKLYSAEYFDFTTNSVVEKVNKWVNEKTHKMIPTLLPDNYDTRDLAVILMNALYFKDTWDDEFYKVGKMQFTCRSGAKVQKEFIGHTDYYRYFKDSSTELVVLGMDQGIDFVVALGSTDNIRSKLDSASSRYVDVKIPEFETESSLSNGELISFLTKRGVSSVFDSMTSDFTPMIDYDELYVSDIIQKAKIKLDKTGVEAAAVTAIMTKAGASFSTDDPIIFTADREFSYYIVARETGDMLFAGRVSE